MRTDMACLLVQIDTSWRKDAPPSVTKAQQEEFETLEIVFVDNHGDEQDFIDTGVHHTMLDADELSGWLNGANI
jgi:hypothetical protein